MKPPFRIAVLECDTPLENTKAKYGGYGGCFEALLRAGARQLDQVDPVNDLQFTFWDVVSNDEYPKLSEIDAVLLTGSKHNSFDDIPWINTLVDFTARVLAQDRVRVIGVCFGHQIVGRAMNVKVGRNDDGWETAVNDVQLSAKGKEIFQAETLSIHQMHRDIVFAYPQGVQELGSSPVCKVQGMYAPGRLITVQGHPEFNEEIMTEILNARHVIGVFDDDTFEAALKRVVKPHDGIVVSKAFLRFLLED
ncbi:MAG: hypothetical protein Q9160_000660 [Pyrenula sp. 1 TL-2023]